MRKLIFAFTMLLSLLCSCTTMETTATAQVTTTPEYFDYTYYDYVYNRPVIYMNGIPYYKTWGNFGIRLAIVPTERRIFIRHHYVPHRYYRPLLPLRKPFYDRTDIYRPRKPHYNGGHRGHYSGPAFGGPRNRR
jgi:hypothetical protein